jgi:hypothetical protein
MKPRTQSPTAPAAADPPGEYSPPALCFPNKLVWVSKLVLVLSATVLVLVLETIAMTEPATLKNPGETGRAPTPWAQVNFRFHEPEALADFSHIERTRLAPQAHFCRLGTEAPNGAILIVRPRRRGLE